MERSDNPPPCRFFLQGRCRFGDRCRFLHLPVEENHQTPLQDVLYMFDQFAGFHASSEYVFIF